MIVPFVQSIVLIAEELLTQLVSGSHFSLSWAPIDLLNNMEHYIIYIIHLISVDQNQTKDSQQQ